MAASLHLPADLESWSPEQVLGLVLEEFPGRVSLACSFQKEESVLLDMLFALEPKARVFALDTHHLFPETYAVWKRVNSSRPSTRKYPAPAGFTGSHFASSTPSTARESLPSNVRSAARIGTLAMMP